MKRDAEMEPAPGRVVVGQLSWSILKRSALSLMVFVIVYATSSDIAVLTITVVPIVAVATVPPALTAFG